MVDKIHSDRDMSLEYASWKKKYQQDFLDFCTGEKGVKVLYDSFFKEILNPEYAAGRLEDWLSVILGERVTILSVLPNDSTRIADETSLLVTDIVVELEDGSIANVEVQKVGYMFPGQRCACYSADLLLRQYKRVRDQSGEHKFSYKDVKNVYTIVLYENSPKEFHPYQDVYVHRAEQVVDSGVRLNLLQKYIFLPLDIFKETHFGIHNGYLFTTQVEKAGISRTYRVKFVQENHLEKVAKGIYVSQDTWADELYILQIRKPKLFILEKRFCINKERCICYARYTRG